LQENYFVNHRSLYAHHMLISDSMQVKIIDFQHAKQGSSEDARMWDIIGPIILRPPEMYDIISGYTQQLNLFSIGQVIF
jgi:hypothetical protein